MYIYDMYLNSFDFNRRWHISTPPNTTKKLCTLFKLIQQSGNFELPREEKSKLEPKEKKFSLLLKMEVCGLKIQQISIFSAKPNFFSSVSNSIFLCLRVNILDYCISLNSVHIFWLFWEL